MMLRATSRFGLDDIYLMISENVTPDDKFNQKTHFQTN